MPTSDEAELERTALEDTFELLADPDVLPELEASCLADVAGDDLTADALRTRYLEP